MTINRLVKVITDPQNVIKWHLLSNCGDTISDRWWPQLVNDVSLQEHISKSSASHSYFSNCRKSRLDGDDAWWTAEVSKRRHWSRKLLRGWHPQRKVM